MEKLPRRAFIQAVGTGTCALLGGVVWQGLGRGEVQGLKVVRRSGLALGTQVHMTALHEREAVAEAGVIAAFAALERVESVMSVYREDSQISTLNRTGTLANADPWLVQLLKQAQELAEKTNGAFDVTVQPLWDLYSKHHRENRLPDDAEVERVRQLVDYRQLEIFDDTIRCLQPGMKVTLNGIAQGFAADQAALAMQQAGVQQALLDTGELVGMGHNIGGQSWTVGVQHPRKADAFLSLAPLADRALATSGDYATTFHPDRSYNHLFDPRTGRSPLTYSSVSIAAPTATQADAFSTALFVLDLAAGQALLKSTPGVDALLVLKSGQVLRSSGFPALPV